MKRVHIIGGKNHGKTTLIVELVREFDQRGLRVGTIKHTHHHHELDTPGKDSHRHREAGAAVVGICSRSMNAVFWPEPDNRNSNSSDAATERDPTYAAFSPMFENCDLVLVEGDSRTRACKLEVWRSAPGTPPLAKSDPSIAAVITDDSPGGDLDAPLWPRSNVAAIVKNLLAMNI